MIGQRPAWESKSFKELVHHFEGFSEEERARLSRLYQSSSKEPSALAMSICLAPERILELVALHGLSAQAQDLLGGLLHEHGVEVQIHGAYGDNLNALKELRDFGFLVWPDEKRDLLAPLTLIFPSVFVLVFHEMVEPSRPSLFLLSSVLSDDDVRALCKRYLLSMGNRVVMLMELADLFHGEGAISKILELLEHPDEIGPAITALELGGMCYWQDVFGFDESGQVPEENDISVANVLPMVNDKLLGEQRKIADKLLDLGVIFKMNLDHAEFSMLAVPEELWINLWTLARDWIVGWIEGTFLDLSGQAVSMMVAPGVDVNKAQSESMFMLAKCIVVVLVSHKQLTPDALYEELVRQGWELSHTTFDLLWMMCCRVELITQSTQDDQIILSPGSVDRLSLLERSFDGFVQEILCAWSLGQSTHELEREVGRAVGLDESWRVGALPIIEQVLEEQGDLDKCPGWILCEGIEHEMTGMGYLRDLDQLMEALAVSEFATANSILGTTRSLWLDILSQLEEDRWYSMELLSGLLQYVLAASLLHHLAHLFEHPEMSQYIPLQRPDYLILPVHVNGLKDWVDIIVHELFVPFGLASVSGERVRLRTDLFKITCGEENVQAFREKFLDELFAGVLKDEGFVRKVRPAASSGGFLRVVQVDPLSDAGSGDEQRFSLQSGSVSDLVGRLDTLDIVRYDTERNELVFKPTSVE